MLKRCLTGFILLGCLLSSRQVMSQNEVKTFSLQDLLQYTIEHNYEMQLFKRELALDRNQFDQRKKLLQPTVNGYFDYLWYPGNVPQYFFPEGEGSILSGTMADGPYPVQLGLQQNLLMGVRLNQPLFDFTFPLAKESRLLASELELARVQKKREDMVLEIGKLYYGYLTLQSKNEMLEFSMQRIETAERILEQQVLNEMASPSELQKIQYQKAKLALESQNYVQGLMLKLKQIQYTIGFPVDDEISIVRVPPARNEAVLNNSVDNGDQNVEAVLLSLNSSAIELRDKERRSKGLPRLDFYADLAWQSQSESLDLFNSTAVNNITNLGLKLNIPIYNAGNRDTEKARLETEKIDIQQIQFSEAQKLRTEQLIIKLASLNEKYKQQTALSEFALRLLHNEEERFEQGLVSIRDVQEARSEYVTQHTASLETYFELRTTELDFLKVNGYLLEYFNLSP